MKIICFVVAGDLASVRHLVVGVPFGRLFDHLVVGDPSLLYHLGDDLTHLLRAVPLAWPVVPQLGFRCAES